MLGGVPTLDQECFFIAPIGDEGSEVRKRSDGVLRFIVARAADEIGLKAVRADQITSPGLITLQAIQHVLGAKAVIADLTGRNPNVFYELAVRHTARLPVVLIAEEGEELPFDIAQMRTVFFSHQDLESADRCRGQLVVQLKEALSGAVESPIATAVDIQALQAGDTVERRVAELITTVEEMGRAMFDVRGMTAAILDDVSRPRSRSNPMAVEDAFQAAMTIYDLGTRRDDMELKAAADRLMGPLDFLMSSSGRARSREALSRSQAIRVRPETAEPSEAATTAEGDSPGDSTGSATSTRN